MELDIQGRIGNQPPVQNQNKPNPAQVLHAQQNEAVKEAAKEAAAEAEKIQQSKTNTVSKEEIERYMSRIIRDASLLNRDLKYSINNETDQVMVKVIDKSTDKVIKEIPPEAIQRLQARLKEQIGLLIDEQI